MAKSLSYFLFWLAAIASVALYRLLPHPFNFTPLGALALVAGAKFRSTPLALALPLISVFLTDAFLGFYPEIGFVYLAFAAVVLLGRLLGQHASAFQIGCASVGGSTLFFAISNFGVWLLNPMYEKTLGDLVRCYVLAIPFYQWTLVGDLSFAIVFFGAYALLHRHWQVTSRQRAVI